MITPSYILRKLDHLFHPAKGVVLMLHRVTKMPLYDSKNAPYSISPQRLEQAILDYRARGYRFVSIDEVVDMVTAHHFGQPFVCFTLDDGYRDNLLEAAPVFRRYDVPFCIFVATDYMGMNKPDYVMMTESELREIAKDPLCTIGAHTISHCRLSQQTHVEKERQIRESGKTLRSMGVGPVSHFAYPYGDMDIECAKIVEQCGYRSAVMAWNGSIRSNNTLYQLPRQALVDQYNN